MKIIFPVLILFFSVSCASAQDILVFGAKVSLEDSCRISVEKQGKKAVFRPSFSLPGVCRLVTHDGTNIAHVEFVNGAYIFFIENNSSDKEQCRSEYTAVSLSKELVFYTTDVVKKSRSCNSDQETQSFQYFSIKLKPYTEKALRPVLSQK